jgi:hypothetical protein
MARSKQSKVTNLKSVLGANTQAAVFVALIASVGVLTLIFTKAAAPGSSIQLESGTLSSPAQIISDANASGGKAVQFNSQQLSGTTVTGGRDTTCVFQKADAPVHVAFCDGFNKDFSNPASENRSGSLDNKLWGVSRTNTLTNTSQGQYNTWYPATLKGCGADQFILPPKDVSICNGRLYEAVSDHHEGQSTLAMYPKQPFDISGGRTGTVVFDVSADSAGPHNAWPEFWWTDKPVPAPVDHRSAQYSVPRNAVGVVFASQCNAGLTGVDHISVINNYVVTTVDITRPNDCGLKIASATSASLNHIEIRMSQSHIEVWGSDPGSTTLKELAVGTMNVTMTKGLTWMLDAHYNACKDGFGNEPQCDHEFSWDNFGFDGPDTYRDLAFDVPDNNDPKGDGGINIGYGVNRNRTLSLPVKGVYRLQTPTGALVTYNFFPWDKTVPSFRIVNSAGTGPWHDTPWPFDDLTYGWRTLDVAVPVSEVQDGNNTIEFKNNSQGGFDDEVISNVDLILVAGSPVAK